MHSVFKLLGGIAALALIGFGLLVSLVLGVTGAAQNGENEVCHAPLPNLTQTVRAATNTVRTPDASGTTSNAVTPANDNPCFSTSRFGAQVVAWAEKMADALTVNPLCGTRRTPPDCNRYTYYTSAFPKEVIQYGQHWCRVHGGCTSWANGNYQCVSFVRGAYSQVFPMNLTNDAFNLWYTYQHQPGWQEIPSAAGDVTERGLPQPGDAMIFKDFGVGHVAVVIAVTAPHDGKNGEVEFANANSTSPYDRMPLLPSLLVDTSRWNHIGDPQNSNIYTVWGYLRPRSNASSTVTRISQLDPAQYASHDEFTIWAYSACSAAAMTEVLNAYGGQYRIHDVLSVESVLTIPGSSPPEPYITPQLGLTSEAGIAETMQRFHFKTTWSDHWTLHQILNVANSGTPVIVSWPPDRYAGGHLVVVVGGDSGSIRIADSSSWNRHTLSVAQFMQWWGGFAAVSTPF
ncbi:MAG TPA: CHAP domain-containing protein [Ktedonobacteraceae bacterium]|nr:CHAP domain-containing protein [Ktedonobacteraceae bacterium]